MNKKKKEEDIVVVFMQEGLVAFVNKGFRFSSGLESYSKDIEKNAAIMGIPSDPFELIKEAKSAGVSLYAFQAWMKLLGGKPLRFTVPKGLQKLELSELIEALDEAKKVHQESQIFSIQ